MSDVLKHRFVSPKLDGPDLTQVQPSAWNDGHRFVGGTDGQVLVRSTADATFGAQWARRPDEWTFVNPTVPAGLLADWDPGIVGNTIIFAIAGGNVDLTGFKPAAPPFPGQLIRLTLTAPTPGLLALYHEQAPSTAGFQIRTRVSSPILLTGYWAFAELQWAPGLGGAWLLGAYGNGF